MPADVRLVICNADNVSQSAIFTAPVGFTTIIVGLPCNVGPSTGGTTKIADIQFVVRPVGGVFLLATEITLSTEGSSLVDIASPLGNIITPKNDVEWRVASVSANGTRVQAGFFMLLVPDP